MIKMLKDAELNVNIFMKCYNIWIIYGDCDKK